MTTSSSKFCRQNASRRRLWAFCVLLVQDAKWAILNPRQYHPSSEHLEECGSIFDCHNDWVGGALLPIAEVGEGGKMSSTRKSCPIPNANRARLRNTFPPPLRRYWDVYMQFLFIRFKNTNKICQASESRLRELTETEGVELSLFLDIFSVWSLYPKQKRGSAQHWPKCDVKIEKFVFQAPQHLFLPSPPDFHWFCSPSPKLPGIRKQLINSLGCKSFLLLLPIGYQEGKNLKCWNFRCGRER